jgi:hypothetical protein
MTNYEYLVESIDSPGDDCIVWPNGKFANGYGQVWDGSKIRGAHVVALELKIPRPIGKVCSIHGNWVPGDKLDAAHGSCHNRLCFNPKHLSWKTRAENQSDRKRDGTDTYPVGERHGKCTIPEAVVEAIRDEYKGPQKRGPKTGPNTGPTLQELADKYGCALGHVGRIVNGKQRSVA